MIECSQGRHIYHLAAKPVYDAFGCSDSQNRRIKGDASIKSRLMVLDFVLAHLSANLLSNEAGKVDFFTTQCGVRSELLPRSYVGRLMYFPDGFPFLYRTRAFRALPSSMKARPPLLASNDFSNSTSPCSPPLASSS